MLAVDLVLASRLLDLKYPSEVESFIREIAGTGVMSDETSWQPVGAQRSNAGAIEVSADEINPLVERVVNGMEAVVDLRFSEWRRLNPTAVIPSNPKEAIEKLFDIPGGLTRHLTENQGQVLANQVQLILRGDKEQPTIVVRDRGIGIHPSDFASTIVSLGQSEKGQKPYLIGMYGQGGSSTFEKCEYVVVVSRRHPEHLISGQSDLAGWTVVRRRLATRSHVYSYLVDPATHQVPCFPGSVAEKCGLTHGTHIAHVSYRNLGGFATQAITNNAFYSLNFRLFDPLIPWTLIEERQMPVRGSRTMRGVPYRVMQHPETDGIGIPKGGKVDEIAVRHHILFDYNDPSYGKIQVEWWIFQDEKVVNEGQRRKEHYKRIESYIDRHRRYARRHVAITRGGQMHAALTQSVFDLARLRQVARSIVVNINTDGLTFEAGASFFSSNRADLKTQSQEVVEQAIHTAIETYRDELRAIERERQEEIVQGRGAADEDAIRSRLDRLIKNFTRAQSGPGTSTAKPTGQEPKFKGRTIPTYLRFARSEQLSIRPGVPTRIDILTDASDKTVMSKHTHRTTESNDNHIAVRFMGGGSGRWQLEVRCSVDAPTRSVNPLMMGDNL